MLGLVPSGAAFRFFSLILVGLFLGCGNPPELPARGSDITGAEFGREFGREIELTDHHGALRTLKDFHGKVVVVFFGYTQCPDVCPTTLSDMAGALRQLPADQAAQVQVLFVSVDPARDSNEVLKTYVPYFNPTFLGLSGTPDEIAKAARAFKVVYKRHDQAGASGYLIDHTAGSFVLDRSGELRLFLPFAMAPEDIAHDLNLLLGSVGNAGKHADRGAYAALR